jgi:hypothetical protein
MNMATKLSIGLERITNSQTLTLVGSSILVGLASGLVAQFFKGAAR